MSRLTGLLLDVRAAAHDLGIDVADIAASIPVGVSPADAERMEVHLLRLLRQLRAASEVNLLGKRVEEKLAELPARYIMRDFRGNIVHDVDLSKYRVRRRRKR